MQKRQFRLYVFQILFQGEFFTLEEMGDQIALFCEEHDITDESERSSLKERVVAIYHEQEILDDKIKKYSKGWALNRIGTAEICILRQAIYEILMDETVPNAVAINEAVELAKQYADEKAPGFINGILGSIAREAEE